MNSKHLVGKAVDIVSRSRWWAWPEFFLVLGREAEKEGMHNLAPHELCHIQYG